MMIGGHAVDRPDFRVKDELEKEGIARYRRNVDDGDANLLLQRQTMP